MKYAGQKSSDKYSKRAKINNQVINCTIDMGSELTLMKFLIAKKLGLKICSLEKAIVLRGFNGSQVTAIQMYTSC